MTISFVIEEINIDIFIWKIIKNNTILVAGIADSWLEAYEDGGKEFEKLFK